MLLFLIGIVLSAPRNQKYAKGGLQKPTRRRHTVYPITKYLQTKEKSQSIKAGKTSRISSSTAASEAVSINEDSNSLPLITDFLPEKAIVNRRG